MGAIDEKLRDYQRKKMLKTSPSRNKLLYKNKIIASKIVYCDGLFRQGSGLMFRSKSAVEDTAWIFRFKKPRRVTLTMFFVFFPIDVVFLDTHNNIIELKENFMPFRNYTSKKEIVSFLELKKGTIRKYYIRVGQNLNFRR